MGEQHLDYLPTATRFRILWRRGKRTGHVAGVFVQIPRDVAGDIVRATLRFELADFAIQFASAVNPYRRPVLAGKTSDRRN